MVGARDVDSNSAYSTSSSSSSEDEGDRHKGRKPSNNLSGLSCFARDGFCSMELSSGCKKSNQSDSDSVSDDEVRDKLPFLRQENERLVLLLDNRDDVLREAKKMRKEHRASLEDARTRVAESCSFASAVPPLLALPARSRLRRHDVQLDMLQHVPRATPPSRRGGPASSADRRHGVEGSRR
jgi:hypothetical protein